ncbi:UNVERIFIED_CONTAM: hypothetical protein H355_002412, partial [Colinus virginianus]
EALDAFNWDQANHIILIVVVVLLAILILIVIVFFYCFWSGNRSRNLERGLLNRDNSKGDTNAEEDLPSEDKDIQTSENDDESVKRRVDYLEKLIFEESLVLDADTAHPRLEVFDGGKSVKDTGTIISVATNSKRFDSHLFILATEGFTSGKHYWEVYVGKKKNWELGVASEAVSRKGTLILCPRNGFWVIALSDGVEYWAYTDPWTRLNARLKPQKIGIFLDISGGQLSFYDVPSQVSFHTFSIAESDKNGKLFPFLSMGNSAGKEDPEPLRLCSKGE